jgi:ketosteroid isomerase-like protein
MPYAHRRRRLEPQRGDTERDRFVQHLGVKDVRLNTLDVEIAGDAAYEAGEADRTLASAYVTAKYEVVWKNIDGGWRLHRDIRNTKGA